MSAECSTRYKLSYIHNPGTEPLLSITLGRALQNAAEKWSDKIAIISRYEGESYTFKQALEKADALAAGLLQFGLKQGDRVAIWGPNSCGWYISRLAVARAGLIAVQIDPAYRSQQLLHALNTVEVKVLICAENLGTTNFYKTVLTLIPELNDCPESGVEINNPKLPALKTLIVISNKQYRGAFRLQDVIVPARPNVIQEIHHLQELIQPDDDSNIQFTSGSTGNPKAALLTNHSLINNSYYVGKRMEFHMEACITENHSIISTIQRNRK
ncbi:medium-chain acyl-CoA ligase ACSF2, mitochondrial-like [Periplaneta americana]|uniref:medium-chain acyl-CoA ligase ACSF2, mitochondrial-like n=1 Tax=Periplaneta americana TaxID=6978 RepID=UPI0037E8242B